MYDVTEKLVTLWPEIVMMVGALVCLGFGLNKSIDVRRATPAVAATAMVIALLLIPMTPQAELSIGMSGITPFVKFAVIVVGLVLLLVAANVPGKLKQTLDAEQHPERFDPGNVMRGEFFAFFLLSLTGVMLTAGADDLAWLFLALELTSLPTYVMVATSRDKINAQESAVKYFFLGALSAAMFLYGFALIYGATGYTAFAVYGETGELTGGIIYAVQEMVATQGSLSPLMLTGMVLAILGISFKIAAVPMHFYTADVYQGATAAVTAFLAIVPKMAGFAALILVLGLVGWSHGPEGNQLPTPIATLIAVLAILTMTVGNVLGLVQDNVKRTLAYSSIAQSGYLLVGLLAGPLVVGQFIDVDGSIQESTTSNGVAAVMFYLIAYGLSTIPAFAVLGCLHVEQSDGSELYDEAQTYECLSGIRYRHPVHAGIMLVSCLSLVGLPPLAGFLGKLYLINSAYSAGFSILVVILVINSAISAGYYLRIGSVCFFGQPYKQTHAIHAPARMAGASISVVAVLLFGSLFGNKLVNFAADAAHRPVAAGSAVTDPPALSSDELAALERDRAAHPLAIRVD